MLTKGFARGIHIVRMTVVSLTALLLVNCGGGGSSTPDADPTGYYTNTGEFQNTGNTGDLNITDLQGMIYQGRLMMFSKAKGLGYDGTISVNGNQITGTLKQYNVGGGMADVNLTATFNPADHSIVGTMSVGIFGTNPAFTAAFKLNYAAGRPASTVADIVNDAMTHPDWSGYLYDYSVDPMAFSLAENASGVADVTTVTQFSLNGGTSYYGCSFSGTFTPIAGSLYTVNMPLTGCNATELNSAPLVGLAALRGSTLIVMAVDVTVSPIVYTYAYFGEFN